MISHEHKFIFVHINKTAGSSIKHSLRSCPHENLGHEILSESINKCQGDPDEYFKFTFVRNPWDKIVSNYFFRMGFCKRTQKLSFKDWVTNSTKKKSPTFDNYSFLYCFAQRPQLDWISDRNGKLLVDFIGRFENLHEDFNIICDRLEIPRQELSYKNKSTLRNPKDHGRKHYGELYDDETKEIIEERFAKDIEYFGYKFGD